MLIKGKITSVLTIVMISIFVTTLITGPTSSNLLSSSTLDAINGSINDNNYNRHMAFATAEGGGSEGGVEEGGDPGDGK